MIAYAAAAYRTLVRLYPHAFWREFHDELEDDFADGWREALCDGGVVAVARFGAHTAADFAVSLVREWLRTPWLPVLMVAAAVSFALFGYTALTVSHMTVPLPASFPTERSDALKAVIVMAIGALIPIAGTILGTLFTMVVRRRTPGRPRRHV